jgi:hypothetical protein
MGCFGGEAAPVLAETPLPISILKLVEFDELQIDLTQLTGDTSASTSKAITWDQNVEVLIAQSAGMIYFFEENLLIPITEGLGAIEIPVDPNIQAFEGEVTFTQFSIFIEDSFFGTHNVKLDFRDFDNQGCSGHTAALPICVRFWLDDRRFISWVFDEVPITTGEVTTVGKGRFKIFLDDLDGLTWEIAIAYDENLGAGESKVYDISMKGTNNGLSTIPWYGDSLQVLRRRMKVSREGPEEVALKQFDTNQDAFFEHEDRSGTSIFKSVGRYIEGFDYWASSFYQNMVGSIFDEEAEQGAQDICARISLEAVVDSQECANVNGQNIRVLEDPLYPEDGHPFISAPTDADVAFPSDFSAAPPADFDSLPKP